MRKTVSFKKDIPFKNNVAEIISIALDHDLKLEERTIKGNLIISGSYKMNDVSINTEEFKYNVPVNIELNNKYVLDNLKIDINNFYYELVDNKVLTVEIEVLLDNLEEREEKQIIKEEKLALKSENVETVEERQEENKESKGENRATINEVKSLFDSFDDSQETYATYQICIVREGDNIDNILIKYGISKELLEQYNDINDVKIGDKLIIPALTNENN